MHSSAPAHPLKSKKRRQSLNLAALTIIALITVLYLTFLISRVPYGSTTPGGGKKGGGGGGGLKFNKIDLAELEEGGEVALDGHNIKKPPVTVHPKKTDAPSTDDDSVSNVENDGKSPEEVKEALAHAREEAEKMASHHEDKYGSRLKDLRSKHYHPSRHDKEVEDEEHRKGLPLESDDDESGDAKPTAAPTVAAGDEVASGGEDGVVAGGDPTKPPRSAADRVAHDHEHEVHYERVEKNGKKKQVHGNEDVHSSGAHKKAVWGKRSIDSKKGIANSNDGDNEADVDPATEEPEATEHVEEEVEEQKPATKKHRGHHLGQPDEKKKTDHHNDGADDADADEDRPGKHFTASKEDRKRKKKDHHKVMAEDEVPDAPDTAEHDRSEGEDESGVSFSNIHTGPRPSKRVLEAALKPFPTETNVITKLYKNIDPNTKDDQFFDDNREFWDEYSDLEDTLKRWQHLNIEMAQGKRAKRYVTVVPVGQLCNRLVAITSAFFFALVTRRGLLIDDTGFYAQSADLFETPGFPWLSKTGSEFQGNAAQSSIRNPEFGVWDETEKLLCGSYDDTYPDKNVNFNVNQYLVPYMTENPIYRKSILQLFRGSDVFHPIQKFLFRPLEELKQQRDEYIEKHFKGHFVVGMQVRSGPDFTSNFMSSHDWSLYKNCAAASTPRHKQDKIKYFIATDTEDGRKAAIKEFGKDKVIFGPGKFLLSNHPKGVQMALMDIMLLAGANDRVTTAWSSYGYFSSGMSGFAANMVVDSPGKPLLAAKGKEQQRFMGVPHKSDKRTQCVRLPTLQPCFHKFESWGASTTSCFKKDMFEREMLNGRYC